MSEPGPDMIVSPTRPLRVQDVALLPVLVLHQRDARRAVRIVLDLAHHARHAELVALEVDDAVLALVPAARRRIEMWPWLSRPPDFLSGSVSDFSGVLARDLGNRTPSGSAFPSRPA
jgi:hypothetical protein